MPRPPLGKKGIYVYIDGVVFKKLWEYISEIYEESTYGALSTEVQNAVVEYLRLKNAQIHTRPLNPRTPTVHRICSEIIHRLKEEGFINQVSTRVLNKVIGEVRGTDERTLRKWLMELDKNGYIKSIGTYTWEIL